MVSTKVFGHVVIGDVFSTGLHYGSIGIACGVEFLGVGASNPNDVPCFCHIRVILQFNRHFRHELVPIMFEYRIDNLFLLILHARSV